MNGKQWCVFLCFMGTLMSALAVASTLLGVNYEWVTTPLMVVFILGSVVVLC